MRVPKRQRRRYVQRSLELVGQGQRRVQRQSPRIIWQVDGDDVQGDWLLEEDKPHKSQREEVNISDQESYQLVKRPKALDHHVPEIFAVD